ncbi:MAG: hypothetical protein ACK559_29390, partial [bacterium]
MRPLHNYLQSGDLFGQRPLAPKCKQHMKMVELLVERLVHDPEGQNAAIFRRWTVDRPRLPDEPAAP